MWNFDHNQLCQLLNCIGLWKKAFWNTNQSKMFALHVLGKFIPCILFCIILWPKISSWESRTWIVMRPWIVTHYCILSIFCVINVFVASSLYSCKSYKQVEEMVILHLFIEHHYKSIVSIIRERHVLTLHLSTANCRRKLTTGSCCKNVDVCCTCYVISTR